MRGRVDGVVLLISVAAVLCGTVVGIRSTEYDVDQRLFEDTILRMQHGEGYYRASADAIQEKGGRRPSQVRSFRTPVIALLLLPLPKPWWRWMAAIPALALCLLSAELARGHLLAQRLAAGLCGMWMIVSLPYLYLHQELWGAPLLVGSALALRRPREGLAAGLALAATAVRELYGLALGVGLVVRSRRVPWLVALGMAMAGALVHAHLAHPVLDPNGYDPPLRPYARITTFLAPGSGVVAEIAGVALIALGAVGLFRQRHDPAWSYLGLVCGPLIVANALSGRSYWSLTWCGPVSAAAALVVAPVAEAALERLRPVTQPRGPDS